MATVAKRSRPTTSVTCPLICRGFTDMRAAIVVLLLSAAVALGAYFLKHQTGTGGHLTVSTAPAQAARPARAASGAAAPVAATAATQTSKLNRDGSETVEEATGDSGAHNLLLAAVASTVAAATPTASAQVTAGPTPVAGGRQLHPARAGSADGRAGGAGRGAGILLVCVPALLCARTLGRDLEEGQTLVHHLRAGAGHLERGPPRARPALLHPREPGEAGPTSRRGIQGDPGQRRPAGGHRSGQ